MAGNSAGNRGNAATIAAYQFKPGESGNPSGRPKRLPVTDYLREQLEGTIPKAMLEAMKEGARQVFFEIYGPEPTFGQMIAFKLVQMSAKGDLFAIREVLERVEGKVAQKTTLTGEDDGPVQFVVTRAGKRSSDG
jgi:Family of unknown function (DUF5681)